MTKVHLDSKEIFYSFLASFHFVHNNYYTRSGQKMERIYIK